MNEKSLKITNLHLAEKTLKALAENEDIFVKQNKNLPLHFQIIREAVQEYEKFQIYEDNYRDLIIRVTADFKIRFISKSCQDIIGFEPQEIIGKDLANFLLEKKELIESMQENYEYNNRVKLFLHRFRCKNEKYVWLETSVNTVSSKDDISQEYLLVSRDITKRKKVENNLQEKTHLLENAYEELSMISHTVSHDLRAPLRRIYGYTQILHDDFYKNYSDIEKDLFFKLRKNVDKMGRIIDSFLFFLSLGSQILNRMLVSVPRIIEEIRKHEYKEVEFEIKSVPFVYADPYLVKILLKEIINNSIKSVKDKKIVKIEVGCITNTANGMTDIYIQDNGDGIKREYIESIFEPFISLSKKVKNEELGMGLTICRRIMKLHAGEIKAQSDEGEGFIIFLSFPEYEKDE